MDPYETLEMFREAEAFMNRPFDPEMCKSLLSRSLYLGPSDREKLDEVLGAHLAGLLKSTKQLRDLAGSLKGRDVPKKAWEEACLLGGSDALREVACGDPWMAYRYAAEIDDHARDDTRTAACQSPKWAFEYALHVDRCPGSETRTAACGTPFYGESYAYYADKGPCDETRTAACKDPKWAFYYAQDVDKGPHPQTRDAADSEEYEIRFPPCDPPEACAEHGRCWTHSTWAEGAP